jgi:hypothetical protein
MPKWFDFDIRSEEELDQAVTRLLADQAATKARMKALLRLPRWGEVLLEIRHSIRRQPNLTKG